ncbi:MAG: glycoside hydrolase family 43 protein [Pyrinomonadaceae bacterium]|nr:glycoside hydrolase family 43 protein [Pyrinomonadaceae bacterium]
MFRNSWQKKIWLVLLSVCFVCSVVSQGKLEKNDRPDSNTFSNPIISGFAPDPSICRAGDDFYLINSTFEYFPGIPIYHSKDLINWNLIGYALHDPSQVELDNIKSSDGIHASTIRYFNGTFYIITTNNIDGKLVNFIVTAKDPKGPWSKPFVLKDAPGIDPSLFFDDDGKVWYTGNWIPPDPEFEGQAEIWLQELNLEKMQLVGKKHYLWRGCCGGAWAEGPHIYKKNGTYYLLISEGGTLYEHAVVVAASKSITGPYQNNLRNPILSHRQLSYDYPITGVGHADLVELKDGRWYMVALGWRYVDGRHGILGRETFLLPVKWETEPYWWKKDKMTFPVASARTGKIELRYPVPFKGTTQAREKGFEDDFDTENLKLEWNFRRTPKKTFYSLTSTKGYLRLFLQPGSIAERSQYSFIGIRQRHFQFEATTEFSFLPKTDNEEAGLIVIQNDRSAFLSTLATKGTKRIVKLRQSLYEKESVLAEKSVDGERVFLKVIGDYLNYSFYYSIDGTNWKVLDENIDATSLSPAVIKGFNYTGVYVGLYASSNGKRTRNFVDFAGFKYSPLLKNRGDWFQRQLENFK